jgi:outer membrane protein OmpA-like peptidoglycan-associated protein
VARISILIVLIILNQFAFSQSMSQSVLFDFNKFEVADSALLNIVRLTSSHKINQIEIEGHCDSVGSRLYNYSLSIKRVNKVVQLLRANCVDITTIKTAIGFGKEKPINKNETELDRQLNRRVFIHYYFDDSHVKENKFLHDNQIEHTVEKFIPTQETSDMIMFSNITFVKGAKIRFENLLFFGGTHRIVPSSFPILLKLVKLLNENISIKIDIQGHVCCTTIETDGYDSETGLQNLSEARAEAIHDFLIEHGITKSRLSYHGFGGSQKVNQDESKESLRRMNRRVEILVLEN